MVDFTVGFSPGIKNNEDEDVVLVLSDTVRANKIEIVYVYVYLR